MLTALGEDQMIWDLSRSGNYSIKPAYYHAMGTLWNHLIRELRVIGKLFGPSNFQINWKFWISELQGHVFPLGADFNEREFIIPTLVLCVTKLRRMNEICFLGAQKSKRFGMQRLFGTWYMVVRSSWRYLETYL